MVKIYNAVTYHSSTNTGKSVTTKGLYFDLEIDEDAREAISSPSKRATALLDVTFIKPAKPKKSPSVYTKTLNGVEVKKIISTMNFDKQNIKRVIDSFLIETKNQSVGTNDCKKSIECSTRGEKIGKNARNTKKRSNSTKNLEESIEETIKQLFSCPKSFHDINAIFECQNETRSSHKNPDIPYKCEDCASIGVRDSQKKPFATEVIFPPRKEKREAERDSMSKERKKRNIKEEHIHCEHYKQLLHKIKDLEQRLKVQEETTLPKDEFKKLIMRQVNHKKEVKQGQTRYDCFNDPFTSEPLSVSEKRRRSSRNREPRFCDKKTSPMTMDDHFWKKGEEFLKPGTYIMNKLILFVENTLKKLPTGINKFGDNPKPL